MKTPNRNLLIPFTALCLITTFPLSAQGPGRGQGGGQGGFQKTIHALFDNHQKIKRTVKLTDTGYSSRTISDDPEVAKNLQKHVQEMQDRLGSGMMIRRWDPAFAELVAHYKDIDHEFKKINGGVEMIAKGKTPEAVKIVQHHAQIVSGFVKMGPAQMHKTHPAVLTDTAPIHDQKESPKQEALTCPKTASPTHTPAKDSQGHNPVHKNEDKPSPPPQ
jgi:hypothetical protein